MRRLGLGLVLTLAPFLAACPQDLSTALVPGSSVQDLRFHISNAAGTAGTGELFRFAVVEFGGKHGPGATTPLWEISLESPSTRRVGELLYGSPPPDFRTLTGPTELAAGGRYFASGGGKGVEFRVSPDGSITEFDPAAESDPFSAAGLLHEEVEPFWDRLRRSLEPADPEAIADLVHYPLRVTVADSSWQVADRAELVRRLDEVFPAELRAQVLESRLDDLIVTSKGLAVASGRLWIGSNCGGESRPHCPPVIFELNRYPGPDS